MVYTLRHEDFYTLLFFLLNAATLVTHGKVCTCYESSRLLASVVSRGRELIRWSNKNKECFIRIILGTQPFCMVFVQGWFSVVRWS